MKTGNGCKFKKRCSFQRKNANELIEKQLTIKRRENDECSKCWRESAGATKNEIRVNWFESVCIGALMIIQWWKPVHTLTLIRIMTGITYFKSLSSRASKWRFFSLPVLLFKQSANFFGSNFFGVDSNGVRPIKALYWNSEALRSQQIRFAIIPIAPPLNAT